MAGYAVEDLTPRERRRIVISAVTPRPIAWISTTSEAGVSNLAPFSSYNYVGSRGPVLLFNTPIAEDGGPKKHSARNALETEAFAVNVVTETLIEEMDGTAAPIPAAESEFDLAGLERAPCETIDAPRVADAVATMECTLYDSIEVRERLLILGDVRYVHLDDSVLAEGKPDARKFDTVGRLGGPLYTVSEPHAFERRD